MKVLVLSLALNAHAQMYKCVDERGKIYYTDKPQAGCNEAAIKGSPPTSGELRQRREDFGAEEREFKRRQLQQQAKETKEQQALAQCCARQRAVRDQRLVQVDEQLRGCP